MVWKKMLYKYGIIIVIINKMKKVWQLKLNWKIWPGQYHINVKVMSKSSNMSVKSYCCYVQVWVKSINKWNSYYNWSKTEIYDVISQCHKKVKVISKLTLVSNYFKILQYIWDTNACIQILKLLSVNAIKRSRSYQNYSTCIF